MAVVHSSPSEKIDPQITDLVQYLARHKVCVTQQIANVSNYEGTFCFSSPRSTAST